MTGKVDVGLQVSAGSIRGGLMGGEEALQWFTKNDFKLSRKPAQQPIGLECLLLQRCPIRFLPGLADLVSDVGLEFYPQTDLCPRTKGPQAGFDFSFWLG